MSWVSLPASGERSNRAVASESLSTRNAFNELQLATRSAEYGLLEFLGFMAMLSMSLAILNILPIPALDGGHLAMMLYEKAIGREIPHRVKLKIQQAGFIRYSRGRITVLNREGLQEATTGERLHGALRGRRVPVLAAARAPALLYHRRTDLQPPRSGSARRPRCYDTFNELNTSPLSNFG